MRHTLIIVLFFSCSISQADGCVKKVFGEYCLGGDIATVVASALPAHDKTKKGIRVVRYRDGENIIFLRSINGRIATVGKYNKPPTMLTYGWLLTQLQEKYGPGEDMSYFLPGYADTASREASILLGKGVAKHKWQNVGWSILLSWANRRAGIVLQYEHDELGDKMRKLSQVYL